MPLPVHLADTIAAPLIAAGIGLLPFAAQSLPNGDLASFGTAGVAITALVWMVREERNERKTMREQFTGVMAENAKAIAELAKAQSANTEALKALAEKVDGHERMSEILDRIERAQELAETTATVRGRPA